MIDIGRLFTRLTYDYWRRTLPSFGISKRGVAVLECGIGQGALLRLMELWFPQAFLYGLDIDPGTLSKIRKSSPQTRLLAASAETLPFPEQRFDVIISLHMIEHLNRPEDFLRETARVLRPEGILVLATPNPQGLGAKVMKSRWSSLIPDHVSLKPPHKWRELLIANGFEILSDGTTGLSGIPMFRKLPLSLLNWGPLFLFGFFPWRHGEAYICLSQKGRRTLPGVSLYQRP